MPEQGFDLCGQRIEDCSPELGPVAGGRVAGFGLEPVFNGVGPAGVAVEPPGTVVYAPEHPPRRTAVDAAVVPEPAVEDQYAAGGGFDGKFGRARSFERGVAVGVVAGFVRARCDDGGPVCAGEIGEHPEGGYVEHYVGQWSPDMRGARLAPGPVDVQAARSARCGAGVGVAKVAAIGDAAGAFAMDGAEPPDLPEALLPKSLLRLAERRPPAPELLPQRPARPAPAPPSALWLQV